MKASNFLCGALVLSNFVMACSNHSTPPGVKQTASKLSSEPKTVALIFAEMRVREDRLKKEHGITFTVSTQREFSVYKDLDSGKTKEGDAWYSVATLNAPSVIDMGKQTSPNVFIQKVTTMSEDLWKFALSADDLNTIDPQSKPDDARAISEWNAKAQMAAYAGVPKLTEAHFFKMGEWQVVFATQGLTPVPLNNAMGLHLESSGDFASLVKAIQGNRETCQFSEQASSHFNSLKLDENLDDFHILQLAELEIQCSENGINGIVNRVFADVDLDSLTLAQMQGKVKAFNDNLLRDFE